MENIDYQNITPVQPKKRLRSFWVIFLITLVVVVVSDFIQTAVLSGFYGGVEASRVNNIFSALMHWLALWGNSFFLEFLGSSYIIQSFLVTILAKLTLRKYNPSGPSFLLLLVISSFIMGIIISRFGLNIVLMKLICHIPGNSGGVLCVDWSIFNRVGF